MGSQNTPPQGQYTQKIKESGPNGLPHDLWMGMKKPGFPGP
jgi:hypothetical protein